MRPRGRPPARRKPHYQATAPQRDERLHLLGAVLVRCGCPADLAVVLAEGFVHRLRRCCWSSLTDVAGNGDDVEVLAGWQGPPRALSAALLRLGYLLDLHGVYVVADAAAEAPEYVKARWRRWGAGQYQAATGRVREVMPAADDAAAAEPSPRKDPWDDAVSEADVGHETLFGTVADEPNGRDAGTPGLVEFKRYYHDAYLKACGVKYPWRSADFKFIERIVRIVGDAGECCRIADAFLADRRPFFAGHDIRTLYDHLAQFRHRALAFQKRADADRGLGSKATLARGRADRHRNDVAAADGPAGGGPAPGTAGQIPQGVGDAGAAPGGGTVG